MENNELFCITKDHCILDNYKSPKAYGIQRKCECKCTTLPFVQMRSPIYQTDYIDTCICTHSKLISKL